MSGDLQSAAEALERAKHALLVATMKGAMPRMTRMEDEQEFLAAVAERWSNSITDASVSDELPQGLAGFTVRR